MSVRERDAEPDDRQRDDEDDGVERPVRGPRDVHADQHAGEHDERELGVQRAVRPAVEVRGHRDARGDEHGERDERPVGEAPGHRSHLRRAARDGNDGGDEDELAADEEGHGELVQVADGRHPKRRPIRPAALRGSTPYSCLNFFASPLSASARTSSSREEPILQADLSIWRSAVSCSAPVMPPVLGSLRGLHGSAIVTSFGATDLCSAAYAGIASSENAASVTSTRRRPRTTASPPNSVSTRTASSAHAAAAMNASLNASVTAATKVSSARSAILS